MYEVQNPLLKYFVEELLNCVVEDIIHIHATEAFLGLNTPTPVEISVLLASYLPHTFTSHKIFTDLPSILIWISYQTAQGEFTTQLA